MKIVQINTCTYGSTGKIMREIAKTAKSGGHECWLAIPKGRHNNKSNSQYTDMIWVGNQLSEDSHIILGRITGLQGYFSVLATIKFLLELDRIQPDVIHIHNLHNSYVNIPVLFRYIKRNQIRIIWTLHDCWAFTGHCPHFTLVGCEKWKTGCYHCPVYREYPQSFMDNSRFLWLRKKKWFCGVDNLTIVTPSRWLADLVKQSFLKDYPVKVIHNGIDLSVFQPTTSDFRDRNKISADKFILLGVAFGWGKRKGLDVFLELAKRLPSEIFQIVLVGTDESIDKFLPNNVISIHRTHNQQELAEIYTAADLFVNPTREDNYPSVNMESIACGTPVLTFRTGGSPEIVNTATGVVVECGDVNALEREIIRIQKEKPFAMQSCLEQAAQFDNQLRFEEYLQILNRE